MRANAGKKFGLGQQDQGKGDSTGGKSPADLDTLPRTEILSNRDTSRHSADRGLDSRHVQNEQLQEHSDNQSPDRAENPADVPDEDKLADERPTDRTDGPRTSG